MHMVDIGWHVFQWTKGVHPFYGKGTHPLLWTGSRAARVKISVRVQLNYCGWPPRFGDSCRKRNCRLNRPLGTLQLSWAPLIVNVVSGAMLQRAPYECAVARHVKVENFHQFHSLLHCQRNSELWSNLLSALCHVVCEYCAHIKTANELWYFYIFCRNILCCRLLIRTVFVWPKVNAEVCLVVFLVSLVVQWAVRFPVNVNVKEGKFPVL